MHLHKKYASLKETEVRLDLQTAYNNFKDRIDTGALTEKDLENLMIFFEEHNLDYRPYQDKSYNYIFHLPALFVYCYLLS